MSTTAANLRRASRITRAAVAVTLLSCAVALSSCSSPARTDPGDITADVDRACAAAGAVMAGLPEPVDAATQTEFFRGSDEALRAATFPIRDLSDDSDDVDLAEMAVLLDSFPRLIGRWTEDEVAFRAIATVMRIGELARVLGTPSCAAETWRPESWQQLARRLRPPTATDDAFVASIGQACASTFGGFTFATEGGAVGDALDRSNAERALLQFGRAADSVVPSEPSLDEYLELLVSLESLDAVLPDVPVQLSAGRSARISDAIDRVGRALDAIDAPC